MAGLPRLLGYAAGHWLAVPGLENLRVDIATIGTTHAHLREVSATYRDANGQRVHAAMRDIDLDYSLTRRELPQLAAANTEIVIDTTRAKQVSPPAAWPQLEMPRLPLRDVRIDELRVVLHAPQASPLDVHGHFHLQSGDDALVAEFRPQGALLRMTASPSQLPEYTLVLHAEWIPDNDPAAEARLQAPRGPKQALRLVAQAPLPVLARLARVLGMPQPLEVTQGDLKLQAEAIPGTLAEVLRTLQGEAQIDAARMRAHAGTIPVSLSVSGAIRFDRQTSSPRISLQPGLNWQAMAEGKVPVQAGGRLDKPFTIRLDKNLATSEGEFPFSLRLPRGALLEGAVERLVLTGTGEDFVPAGWSTASAAVRLKGRLKQWKNNAVTLRDLQAAGGMNLHWDRASGWHGALSIQVDTGKSTWTGEKPLTASPSTWKLNAEVNASGTAKSSGDFWSGLSIRGNADTPQLKMSFGSGQALTVGPTRLRLLRFQPGRQGTLQNAQGEWSIAADAIRLSMGPSVNLGARFRLGGGTLRSDGQLQLKQTKLPGFAGSHALARGCGTAAISGRQDLPTLDKLLQPRPPALLALGLHAGNAEGRFRFDWCMRPRLKLNASGTFQMLDGALGWERAHAENVQLRVQVDGLQPMRGSLRLSARRGELATGTPLSDANVDLTLNAGTLAVNALNVEVFGGRIHSGSDTLPWPLSAQRPLKLVLERIDLERVLALFAVNGLTGSGELVCVLPLAYRDGALEIVGGELHSLGPGTLKYAANPSLPDNPGLQALRDFHYRQLGIRLRYAADGAYRVQAKLEGNNPDFYNGFPIRFGLNINGELPGIFRAAAFSGDFSRHILEQLQSGKLE